MKKFLVALFLLVALPAQAGESVLWKIVGDWKVMVDRSIGDGCFVTTVWVTGTVFRAGFNPSTNQTYIVFADANWKSLEVGKVYPLSIQFDKHEPWSGGLTGFQAEGIVLLQANLNDPKGAFFSQLSSSQGLTLTYQDKMIANLALKGSADAVKELLNCQAEMPKDPFAGKAKKEDPFA